MSHSSYLGKVFDKKSRAEAIQFLQHHLERVQFDAIAVRGVSGITMGSILAHAMDKELIVVRKPGELNHADVQVELPDAFAGSYIIVDDFVSSGSTVAHIIAGITGHSFGVKPLPRCVGILEYHHKSERIRLRGQFYAQNVIRTFMVNYPGQWSDVKDWAMSVVPEFDKPTVDFDALLDQAVGEGTSAPVYPEYST